MSIPTDPAPDSLSDSLLERLYAALELDDEDRDAAIDELCDLNPKHAATLREYAARAQNTEPLPCREFLDRIERESGAGDRYEVKEVIGRGGMGTVFRARDRHLDRAVAMKVIHAERTSDADDSVASQVLQRFLDEAQITGQLDHPGVVPVYQVGTGSDHQVWFTMRLVRGRTVDEILRLTRERKEGWTTARALEVIVKMCDTLAFAHSRQVVHRDLKPSNVMVGRFGEVYVMDWGLARVLTRADHRDLRIRPPEESQSRVTTSRSREIESDPGSPLVTMDGTVVGTPSFMALEQAEGRVDQVGPRSDVYSIGAILYALLTGQTPYLNPEQKASPYTLLRAVLDGPPRPIQDYAPDTPSELIAICEKAMSRGIEHRYSDCRQMASDIRAYLEGRVVQAHRTGALAEMRMWFRRNRAFALAAGLAVIMLATGGVAALVAANAAARAEREESLRTTAESARKAAERAKVDIEFARDRTRYTRRLLEAELAVESDPRRAKRALEDCVESMRGPEWYVLRLQVEASTWQASAPKGEAPRFARFSSDSATFLTVGARQLRIWAPPAREARATFEHPGYVIDAIATAPDLSRIVSSGGGHLAVWEPGHSAPVMTAPCDTFFASADFRFIAFRHERVVTVWDREAKRPFVARQHGWASSPADYLERVASPKIPPARIHAPRSRAVAVVENFVLSSEGTTLRVEQVGRTLAAHTTSKIPWRLGSRTPKKPRAENRKAARILCGRYRGHERSIEGIVVSPDGEWALSHASDGEIRLWSIPALTRAKGLDVSRMAPPILPRSIDWHAAVRACVSPDGARAVTQTADDGVWLWDLERETPIDVIRGVRPIRVLAFLDNANVLAIYTDGTTSSFEHAADTTWSESKVFLPANVTQIAVAAAGKRVFFSTDRDRITGLSLETGQEVWSTSTDGRCDHLVTAQNGATVAWSTRGKLTVYGVDDGTIREAALDEAPSQLALDVERRLIAVARRDTVELRDLEDLQPFRRLRHGPSELTHLEFENHGLTLFAVDALGTAAWWSTSGEAEPLATYPIGRTGEHVWIRQNGRVIWDFHEDSFGLRRRSFVPRYHSQLKSAAERRAIELLEAPRYSSLPTARQRCQLLEQDASLQADVRKAAERLARIDGDDIDRLETQCWSIVSNPTRSSEQYTDGLLTAQQLTRQFPANDVLQTNLGLALYRLGRFEEAWTAFEAGRAAGQALYGRESLLNLGFAAVCLARLGREPEARAAARHFRSATTRIATRERERARLFGMRGQREPLQRLFLLRNEIIRELERHH